MPTVDIESWIAEARTAREQTHEHRTLTGAELRAELQRCRALGLAKRHADRQRRARAATDEDD